MVLRDTRVPHALVKAPGEFGGRIERDCLRGDLLIEEGRVRRMLPPGAAREDHAEANLAGRMVLPRLAEAHCHLDKCHTVSRLGSVGGDLHRAMEEQHSDRPRWTGEDIRNRAGRGLAELRASGCGALRTHIDWHPDHAPEGRPPIAWEVMDELAHQSAPHMVVQRCALLSLEIFDDRRYVAAVARQLAASEGIMGVFVLGQADMARRLHDVIEVAERHGLALDFHVDESLRHHPVGLDTIARTVIETGFEGPVLCGHACALMNLTGDPLRRLIERLVQSGIAIVALPATNLYLQGRDDGTPRYRGITRVRELAAAGVAIAFGSDNVADAFCPVGRLDPMHSLALAVVTAHLDPPFGPWLGTVTTKARRAMGLDPRPIDCARTSDLLVADACHSADVVRGAARSSLEEYLLRDAGAAPEPGFRAPSAERNS